ncbi:Ras-related protein raba3 [Orobanche hederae]
MRSLPGAVAPPTVRADEANSSVSSEEVSAMFEEDAPADSSAGAAIPLSNGGGGGNSSGYRAVTSAYYRGALGAMLVYDVTKRLSFDHVARWVEELRAHADNSIVIVLVGNKADLVDLRTVPSEDAVEFAEKQCMYFFETSALSGDNVEPVFLKLLEEIYGVVSKKALDSSNVGKSNGGLVNGLKIDTISGADFEVSEMKKLSTCSC